MDDVYGNENITTLFLENIRLCITVFLLMIVS